MATLPTGPWSSRGNTFLTLTAAAAGTYPSDTNGTSGFDRFSAAFWEVDVTAFTATSLDVYIQQLLPDGTTWSDIAAFTQMTATGKRVLAHVSGGNTEYANTDGSLTAGSIRTVPFGPFVRVKAIVAGAGAVTATITGTAIE